MKNAALEITKGKKTAILLGATGLVGSHCLEQLLLHANFRRVVVFTRRPTKRQHERLVEHVIDFDQLPAYRPYFKGEDLFLCLGTTMRKAGNRKAFFTVDYTYPYQAARMAADNGVNQVLSVSSVGADADAFFFYSKVKGLLENALKEMPFWSVHLFRPSVLLGERNEHRWGEQLAGQLGRGIDYLTGGMLTKYRPIEAEIVAKAMVNAAQRLEEGIFTYPSHYLQQLAEETYDGNSYLEK